MARTLSLAERVRCLLLIGMVAVSLPAGAADDALLYRYHQADTTLTFTELRELYFHYARSEAYAASLDPMPADPLQAVELRPLSLQALYEAAVVLRRQGKTVRSEHYALQLWMLGEMMYHEFTGDAHYPYPVLYREDERLFLYNWHQIDSVVSETRQNGCDVVQCALPPDWVDCFWFRPLCTQGGYSW